MMQLPTGMSQPLQLNVELETIFVFDDDDDPAGS